MVNRKFASPNRLHRETEDQDIRGNGKASISVPIPDHANAAAVERLVPGQGNWRALPDGRSGGGNTVGQDDADQCVAAISEPLLDKDSAIEQENRSLCKIDGELVEDLGNVKHLSPC